jgi:hypothetical protein
MMESTLKKKYGGLEAAVRRIYSCRSGPPLQPRGSIDAP